MRQDPFGRQSPAQRRGGVNPRFFIIVLFALYGAYYWFSNRVADPITGETVLIDQSIGIEDEKAMGLQAYTEILQQEQALPRSDDRSQAVEAIARRLIARVDEVEAALAAGNGMEPQHLSRGFEWDVRVIESDQANAFCLPGGKMAVYTGLFQVAQNEDALAVVMGHEIAHALLRHGAQRMSQQKLGQLGEMAGAMSGMDPQQQQMVRAAMGYGYLLPYARKHETEADAVGLMLAAAACYDPREAVPLWERMSQASGGQAPPEFASTHPNPGTRIANLQALMPKAQAFYDKYCGGGAR